MKNLRIYLSLFLSMTCAALFADGPTATLQQGDVLTVYYGNDAFQKAYAAAEDGGIITLSPGTFTQLSANLEKSLTINGTYGMSPDSANTTYINQIIVKADNVKIEGILFQYINLGTITNCTIKRCGTSYLTSNSSSDQNTNTLVDQCIIFQYDHAFTNGVNYAIKNSTINYFYNDSNPSTQLANITNCWIWNFYCYNSSTGRPYAVYKNNVLCINSYTWSSSSNYNLTLSAPSEFYNNCFYLIGSSNKTYRYMPSFSSGCLNTGNTILPTSGTAVFNMNPASITNSYFPYRDSLNLKGADNTPMGIMGGTGFNDYPAIPRVLNATIDAQNDGEGYLNASIKVKAER